MPQNVCTQQPDCPERGTAPNRRLRTLPTLDPTIPHSPVVVKQLEKRASDVQLRVADSITAFAGSMKFVYLHVLLFAVWMLVLEKSPWPTLTLVVSLEAIFLSTFVMIGQNRQAAFQQAKADHDYSKEEKLLEENTDITRMIQKLTIELHEKLLGSAPSAGE
jgi:uncharacterized membrane protein